MSRPPPTTTTTTTATTTTTTTIDEPVTDDELNEPDDSVVPQDVADPVASWWDIDLKERATAPEALVDEPSLAFSVDVPVDEDGEPDDVSVFFVGDGVVILTPDAVTSHTRTGEVVWTYESEHTYDNLIADDDMIVVDGRRGAVALDPATGDVLTTAEFAVSLNPIGFIDGGVWGTNGSGDFTGIDPILGTELWKIDTDTGSLDFSSKVTATTFDDEQDFDDPYRLRWFDIDTGEVLHDPLPKVSQRAITIGDDEVCAASDDEDGAVASVLRCFDLESGALRWQTDLDVPATYGTLMVVNEDLIAYTPEGGPVVVYETATGDVAWTEDDGTVADTRNHFLESATGFVVTTSENGELYARDVPTGELRWSVPDVRGAVVPAGEVVYVLNSDEGGVRAFDTTGDELWSLDIDGLPLWFDTADDGTGLAIADQSTIQIYTQS